MNQQFELLLIEDDPAVGQSLRAGLEWEGFAVTWVKRGQEGVDYARDHHPHDASHTGGGTMEAQVPNANERRRIPMQAIRAVVKQIAAKFQPEKIILFGSHAYGQPRPESDVDLLVVMDTPLRSRQQRLEISRALLPRPFPLDVIIRTPRQLEERIAMGDLFLLEITTQGKVLYEQHRGS